MLNGLFVDKILFDDAVYTLLQLVDRNYRRMSGSVPVCAIDPALKEQLREFRFRRATNSK